VLVNTSAVLTSFIGNYTDNSLFVVQRARSTAVSSPIWVGEGNGTGPRLNLHAPEGDAIKYDIGDLGYRATIANGNTLTASASVISARSGAGANQMAVRVNRGTDSTATAAASFWTGGTHVLSVGGIGQTGGWNGDTDIAEIIVLDRRVTDTERRSVEDYLARKWNITIAP
jgi:hypothetical protein